MKTLPLPLAELHARARHVAGLLRLPFRTRAWRGVQGNWQGAGVGSSLDFQDHRPYVAGDDPRYINWQAYARTGAYTMKLYREEVSPAVDLAVDLSPSMFVDEPKAVRTAELLYWAVECAVQSGAALRCYILHPERAEPLALDSILSHAWMQTAATPGSDAVRRVPWRHGSLRVVLSDLLWPGDAQPVFHALSDAQGHGVVLAPFCREEAEPAWAGNLELLDCESATVRHQRVDPGALQRYRAAYQRHFDAWEQHSLRYHVPLARISATPALAESLRPHLATSGAVEWGAE
jgi:uncharacterized protein (DUF58 family)